jgi:ACT domain-containing protein
MKAVISVLGKDKIGIIYNVTSVLAEYEINILDINQTIIQDYFSMVMIVDLQKCSIKFEEIQNKLEKKGQEIGLSIRIQHEDIFNSMYKI